MADPERVYTDEEFALVLHKAAELANRPEAAPRAPAGLTLAEMKEAAVAAGFDPALIERAARLLPEPGSTGVSLLARVIGGPPSYRHTARLPTVLDETAAAEVLSAVRIAVDRSGGASEGHAGATGMTWHTSDELERFSVTARSDADGTHVTVALDRGSALFATGAFTAFGAILAGIGGTVLCAEVAPILGTMAAASGAASALAVARGYWAASSRAARDRVERAMDSVARAISATAPATGEDGMKAVPGPDPD